MADWLRFVSVAVWPWGEIARLRDELDDVLLANASLSLEIDRLTALIAPLDHDGDGKPGGSKRKRK